MSSALGSWHARHSAGTVSTGMQATHGIAQTQPVSDSVDPGRTGIQAGPNHNPARPGSRQHMTRRRQPRPTRRRHAPGILIWIMTAVYYIIYGYV